MNSNGTRMTQKPWPRGKRTQAVSTDVVRDINRQVVLNLIRTRHPISRADLARVSGLQRSTISLIVEDLIEEKWVVEGAMGRLPRGRRPTFLRLNQDRVIIAVDLRPSQTTVALADINGQFSSQEVMPTPTDAAEALEMLIASIQRIAASCKEQSIEGIGISLPGRYDHSADELVFAPNLHWPHVHLRDPIVKATGLPVEIENAANACVLAAVWFDPQESPRNLIVVTVSEGIGTGLLVNGQLAQGLRGMAGEFGHVSLDPKGPVCGCGNRGCWEMYASNRAALRYYLEGDANVGDDLRFTDLLSRAQQGDARASRALETMAQYLGRGLRMLIAGLAPERILIVGDLTRSWTLFAPVIDEELRSRPLPTTALPRIVPAHEDGLARLRGTVALVLQKHFQVYA